jgi:DNA-binding LacI/PurR family transcriptional regulator
VLKSAERLGYQPNVIASILSRRKSNIVGIVISDMQNPFYPALLDLLTQGLQAIGRQSLLFSAPAGSDISDQLVRLRQYHVDAVIVASATVSSGAALKWAADGRQVILINRTVPDAPVSSVCCDNVAGAEAVADHLHDLGHRRVAYVAGPADTSTNIERETAFTRRVAELGMTLSARIATGQYSYATGREAALEAAKKKSDAIFFCNDIMALGGIDALRDEAGLRVPEDISVVGFDDIPMASWLRYQLTTVRQPMPEMVDLAIDLLSKSADAGPPRVHRIGGGLILRKTTARR